MKTQELITSFMKDSTQANFDAMKKNYLALSLVYEALASKEILTDFFFLPTFDAISGKNWRDSEWHKLSACSFGELKTWALEEIAEKYSTFYEWLRYCFHQPFASQELALQHMRVFKLSFDPSAQAFRELENIKNSFKELPVLGKINDATVEEVEYILFSKMKLHAASFPEWEFIFKNSTNPDNRTRAFEEMQKFR